MPAFATSKKDINKIAWVLFGCFFVYAAWLEFSPKPEPGVEALAQANLIMKSSPTPEQIKKACALYAQSTREGNHDAALGLSDCVRDSNSGTEASRKALRYMLLTMAIGVRHTDRNPEEERKALGLTMEEINEARQINVSRILNGEITAEDLAGSVILKREQEKK